MTPFRLLPVAALLMTAGCAYDGYAQGYDNGYGAPPPGGYSDGAYPQGQDVVSVDVFYEQLAPYGRWVNSRWGNAFQPNVAPDWRPYTNGRWGENQYWISDEPFGEITDHYGRWGYEPAVGWVWVPGTQWAPSWVAFRDSDEYAGWAPIPPGLNVSVGIGFGGGYDNYDSWYAPSWVWVPRSYLYQPRFGGRIVGWDRGRDFWARSRWENRGDWHNGNGSNNHGGGRPGGWQDGRLHDGRPNDGRPGGGRPGGWNGDGRPGQNGGVSGVIGGGLAGQARPGWNGHGNDSQNGRPTQGNPGWNGGYRPESGRPGYNGRPAAGQRPAWNAGQPSATRPVIVGEPAGVPGQGYRPPGGGYQGGGYPGGRPAGGNTVSGAIAAGTMQSSRPAPQFQGQPQPMRNFAPAPQQRPQPQAQPQQQRQERQERQQPTARTTGPHENERPQ